MPIFDIICPDCLFDGEVLVMGSEEKLRCPSCGGERTIKFMSVTSSLTSRQKGRLPGFEDTACCGNRPGQSEGCTGPGSCCGRH